MTELNTFNALKQEEKAIIHSGTGLPWDGLAQQMIYLELGLAGAFTEQKFGFQLYSTCPKSSSNHSTLWHGQLLTRSIGKEVQKNCPLLFPGSWAVLGAVRGNHTLIRGRSPSTSFAKYLGGLAGTWGPGRVWIPALGSVRQGFAARAVGMDKPLLVARLALNVCLHHETLNK